MPKLKGELRPAHGNTVLCLSRKTIIEDVIVEIASRELSSILHNILVGTVFLAEYRKAIVLTAAHYRFRRAIYR